MRSLDVMTWIERLLRKPSEANGGPMPRLLDLFCGAGGSAVGYHRAGFDEIVGVDIVPQPNYPFRFIQADAIALLDAMIDGQEDIAYDLIHASPPCQAYSVARQRDGHPRLVEPTLAALEMLDHPWVVENVPGAGLTGYVLCGSMFGLQVQRHRIFELSDNWPLVLIPACNHRAWEAGRPWEVAGHGGGQKVAKHRHYRNLAHAQELMQMPWVQTKREVVEAIPPAYTEYLGRQFLDQLARQV